MIEKTNKIYAGQAVIAEAAALLEEMTFSDVAGDYRDGTMLDIQVLTGLNQDEKTTSVYVTLHAFGHRAVDWVGLALKMQRDDELGVAHELYALVNPHGHARFPSVPAGGDKVTYKVTLDKVHWNEQLWQEHPKDLGEQGPMLTWLDEAGAQRLCRILKEGVFNQELTNSRREGCLDALMVLARQTGAIAKPALAACLSILADPETPLNLVGRVVKGFASTSDEVYAERLCRILKEGAVNTELTKARREAYLDALTVSAHQTGTIAKPAFAACLSILCDPYTPVNLVARVANDFSPKTAGMASADDLTPYIEQLTQAAAYSQKPEQRHILFVHQARVFGAILAERPLDREDDRQLLHAFVNIDASLGYVRTRVIRTTGAIPTKGAVKTAAAVRFRGAVGTKSKMPKSPLVELARAGGRRVRDFLIKILREKPGNEGLIEMLKSIVLK